MDTRPSALQEILPRWVATLALVLFTSIAGECSDMQSDALDCYSPENVLRFAESLYGSGDYVRAAGEFERYLVLTGHAAGTDSIYYRMLKAFFLGGAYDRCTRLLDEFPRWYPSSSMNADVSLYRSIVEFRREDYRGAIALAQMAGHRSRELERVVIGMSYLSLGDIEHASLWACGAAAPDAVHRSPMENHPGWATTLCASAREAGSLPMKSAWLAGGLSTVMPGAGKVYCGRPYDGLYSFLIVGLTAWLAYDGFERDGMDSERGWIFGVLGGALYLGNIYGSTLAARLRNDDTYHDFLRGIQIDVALP